MLTDNISNSTSHGALVFIVIWYHFCKKGRGFFFPKSPSCGGNYAIRSKAFNKKKTEYVHCACFSWRCSILDKVIMLKFQTNPGNVMNNTRTVQETQWRKVEETRRPRLSFCVSIYLSTQWLPLSRLKEFLITLVSQGG